MKYVKIGKNWIYQKLNAGISETENLSLHILY